MLLLLNMKPKSRNNTVPHRGLFLKLSFLEMEYSMRTSVGIRVLTPLISDLAALRNFVQRFKSAATNVPFKIQFRLLKFQIEINTL